MQHEREAKSGRLIGEQEWSRHRFEAIASGVQKIQAAGAGSIPDVLLAYQKRLLATTAFHQITVCEKSRRTGATWALGADAVLTAAAERGADGMDVLYLGYNLDMTREFIEVCAMWAKAFDQAASEVSEFIWQDTDKRGEPIGIQAFRVRFASGFEIVALTSRPRSLRGRQGYVIIDEAAFHDDLEEVLKAALAFRIWGGKVCVISTHDGEDNPFNQLVQDVHAGRRKKAKVVRFDFDEALEDGLYERICLVTGKEWSVEAETEWRAGIIGGYGEAADEELFCIPAKGSGVFLPGSLIRSAMKEDIPVFRWEVTNDFVHEPDHIRKPSALDWCEEKLLPGLERLDPLRRHALGSDVGRFHDLTVFWPLTIERNMHKTTPFVVELRNVPFKEQELIGKYIADRLPRLSGFCPDGTGLGLPMAEAFLQKYGAHIVEVVMLSQAWYRENMPKFKSVFEDAEMSIPKDDDTYSDLRLIRTMNGVAQIPTDKRTTDRSRKDRKRHGDSAIACALANYAAERDALSYYGYRSSRDIDRDPFTKSDGGGFRRHGGLW